MLTEYTDEKLASEMVDEIVREGDKWRTGEIDFEYFVRMVCPQLSDLVVLRSSASLGVSNHD